MRTKGSAEELEARRLRAFVLFKQGLTPTQVAEHIGVTRQTAQKWKGLIRDVRKESPAFDSSECSDLPTYRRAASRTLANHQKWGHCRRIQHRLVDHQAACGGRPKTVQN